MAVLSYGEILTALNAKVLKIVPFSMQRLTPAGYDFASNSAIHLLPKEQKLVLTTETVDLSPQILATIHLKSSLAREGIIGSFSIIDPGFRGKLTLALFNSGMKTVDTRKNEPIVQVVFHKTGEPSIYPYEGKYQNSYAIVQSRRKAHFRKLPSSHACTR